MASALKCDRCKNYFDYDPSAKNNFIAFGHKDIIVGRNFPVKDICPNCMDLFMKWFENPDNYDPQDLVKNFDEEYQKELEGIKTYAKYEDPCVGCHNALCEQCFYGYISEEEKKKRWLEKHKKEEEEWTDEDCDCIGCWECKYFRQDKNIHNPYDEKDAYYCSHKKLYISGNVSRPCYTDMRYTDFDKLGCKEEK